MELQVGVKVLLENGEGKYLLLRRSAEKYPDVEAKWDIVGGRIEPGTPLLENLKREVREETGLELSGDPRLLAAQDILRVPGRHVVRLTYAGKGEGEVRLNEEHDEFAWVSLEELRNLEQVDGYLWELLEQGIV